MLHYLPLSYHPNHYTTHPTPTPDPTPTLVFSPDGLLKLVFEQPSGRIIGVHIVGDDACEVWYGTPYSTP